MTPEQKQLRIEEIRERNEENQKVANEWQALDQAPPEHLADIGLLLSIIEDQETMKQDHYFVPTLVRNSCAKCAKGTSEHPGHDQVATSMRSACVEKLRSSLYDPSLRFSDEGIKAAITDWTNILIRRLESLSIEKPKE